MMIFYLLQKKANELSFCSRPNVSRPMYFCIQESEFSTIKEIFFDQEEFPKSRNFPTMKEILHNQRHFPQSKKFFAIKEIF